jgi:outer membrane protein assembly factor BamB
VVPCSEIQIIEDEMKNTIALYCLLFFTLLSPLLAQADSQWRGPERDGIYPGEDLLEAWPEEGPRLVWSMEGLGEGYSSAAVTTDRIYVTGMTRGEGVLYAFSLDRKPLWTSSYGREWSGSHPGARTTPTVAGGRIYVMSAFGRVVCFDGDGKEVWSRDLAADFGARNLQWGMTESLLVDGDRLFCTPGGRRVMVAVLDRNTGETLEEVRGNGETSGYCSPRIVQHGSRRILITMTERSVVGVDADTYEYLWKQSHVTDYNVNANTPLFHEGDLFTVSGYGTGGQMFRLSEDGSRIERLWKQGSIDSQMGAAVLVDGHIYGSGHNRRGWHCVNWTTGKVAYSARKIGNKGNIIFADGMLYCYSERGDVALVRPDPGNFDIVSSFRIKQGSGPHWAHPVIRDGLLYIRHGGVLMVFDISAR